MISDDSPGYTSKRTTVNGNEVSLVRFDSSGREHNQAGRRLAARLPRDMDGLSRVLAGEDGGHVFLDPHDGDAVDSRTFEAPDGYEIVEVSLYGDGQVCVELEVRD